MTKQSKTKISIKRVAIALGAVLILVFAASNTHLVFANRASDLREEIAELEKEIAANRSKAAALDHEADTLAAAVAQFDSEITATIQEINLIQLKLDEIQHQLDETRKELERQKDILRQSLREHYTYGDVRTIELLAESESFADFFDQQEYVNRIRSSIQDSAKKVAELEAQLVAQEAEQQRLLQEQQTKKSDLEARRAAKQRLLDETRGEEALYRARLAGLEREHSAAEAEMDRYIASLVGSGVSLGPVSEGEVIGGVGNTGYSTGPHLHFAIQQNGSYRNPISVMNDRGWAWPVPGYGMTQNYYPGSHNGIDIGTQGRYGVPVVATGDGDIIHRGCLGEGRYRNYAVLIKHPGGYVSRYIHLNPPADPAYNSCRANTYY